MSFGASLRRERELRGVTLQEIAASTKIGVSMLKAIEDDRLDKLPQGLFVRGFVREYARFLALDEQKILNELSFHAPAAPASGALSDSDLDPVDEVSERRRGISSRLSARLINGGLAAAVIVAVAVLIVSPSLSRKDTAASVLPPVDAPSSRPPGGHATVVPQSTLVQSALASTTASVLPEKTQPQPLQLTLTATEDCWIGLDVGGDRVEDRVLRKGESFSITARQNASLAVGNAGGLLIAIDSGPPMPLGNRGEVKRNIPLSPEAIGALSAGAGAVPVKPIG